MCHALHTHTKHKQTYLKISEFCKQLMASHCTKTLTHFNSKHSLIKRWHETPLSRWQLKYCDSTRWFLWRYSEVFDSCMVNQPWVMILIKPQWASLLRNGIVLRRSRLMAHHEVGLMVELASVDCINCTSVPVIPCGYCPRGLLKGQKYFTHKIHQSGTNAHNYCQLLPDEC